MREIVQIRKLSLYIFLIPLIAVNLCLFISVNYSLFDNTIFLVDEIGKSGFTIPYIDGSLSISRASRTFPQYLIFKPSMIITAFLLYIYWKNNNKLICKFYDIPEKRFYFKIFGVLSAFFLATHSILLGIDFDIKVFKFLRRVVLLSFIIFEIIAQALLVYNFYKLKQKLSSFINKKILTLKLLLVSILIIVALISIPFLLKSGNIHFKHGLEWNYFIGVIMFYFFTSMLWKKQNILLR